MSDRRNGTVGRRGTDLWFKMFSSDYLTDGRIDDLPREAEGLLIRMWCVCNIEGSCPADPETLARKTRCQLAYVLHSVLHCAKFFDLRDDRYYSARMEREKLINIAHREAAASRWKKRNECNLHTGLHDANDDANTPALRKQESKKADTESKALVAKATRKQLPDDFRPKEHHKNLADRLSVCLEDEFEKFRDFHKAKGNVMKDWDLALNTWLRNTRHYGGKNGNANHRPRGNPECPDCGGEGIRASKLTPGRAVTCECVTSEAVGNP